MAFEIREIAIKMRVGDGDLGGAPVGDAARQGAGGEGRGREAEIVDECVRRVLAIIKLREER